MIKKLLTLSAAFAVAACSGNPEPEARVDPESDTNAGVVVEDTVTTDTSDMLPGQGDVNADTLGIQGDSALIDREIPDSTTDPSAGYEQPSYDQPTYDQQQGADTSAGGWQEADTTRIPGDSALIERSDPDTSADTTQSLNEALDDWADSTAQQADSLR